jgi:two-component system, cell cycle response regulator
MSLEDTERTQHIAPEAVQAILAGPGHGSASLIVISGWEIGREVSLAEEETILGRSPLLRTSIALPSVSRQHCRFIRAQAETGDTYEVQDMGSLNGTLVNNVRVESAKLQHGDKIQVGDVLFKFLLQDPIDAQFYREIHRLIHHDQHTGLLTLDSFKRYLEQEIRSAKGDTHFTLSMTDLDGLKKVNDTLGGHLAGSMVVKDMGRIIRETLRKHDVGGIYGGDEAILLYRGACLEEAQAIAERIRITIEEREFTFSGRQFGVSISQGLAEWPRHGRTMEAIIHAADSALYAAKAAGRNCIKTADG